MIGGRGKIGYPYGKEMLMAKGVPKKDSSGGGTRANRGRGGCKVTRKTGRGK